MENKNMANIFLTRKCNLKCPYCFADEFVNKGNEEISIENFKTIVDFIKTENNKGIGLIGGEPTTHSKFNEILQILQNDNDLKDIAVFTNGLEIDKQIEILKNEKFQLLINCNSPNDIGEHSFNKLKNNIKLLKRESINFCLGINLYSDKLDYNYIFDLLKIAQNNFLRFSISLPNKYKEETNNVLKDLYKFKPFLFEFFNSCIEHDIVPYSDCNFIPKCLIEVEDKRILIKMRKLAIRYKSLDVIARMTTCKPVIDIMPDLTAIRCFGMSEYEKVKISEFKNIENLRKYFFNKIDIYARITHLSNECPDCKARYLEKCAVCFTYKMKKMKENIEKINCSNELSFHHNLK